MLNLIRRAWNGPVHAGDIERALASLGLDGGSDAIVHASLSSFGYVQGGAPAVIDALRASTRTVVAPAFTYYCLAWPRSLRQVDWPLHPAPDGPAFTPGSPVSPDIGRVPQTLLDTYGAPRSNHPALSFAALGPSSHDILVAQTNDHPYAPIGALYRLDGHIVLLGVDQRSNTTIHYGEYLAGRPLLDRYATGPHGLTHTYFPNCSAGFNALEPQISSLRTTQVGRAIVTVMRVRDVVESTIRVLRKDPEALLCHYANCRCQAVRRRVAQEGLSPRCDAFALAN
jgi:aminoglycoside 3-N-acetyltransferase